MSRLAFTDLVTVIRLYLSSDNSLVRSENSEGELNILTLHCISSGGEQLEESDAMVFDVGLDSRQCLMKASCVLLHITRSNDVAGGGGLTYFCWFCKVLMCWGMG